MKRHVFIGLILLLLLSACHSHRREARQMVARAERLFDTNPDSTASLIDSVLRIPVYFDEKRRMDIALLQAEALLGDRGQEIPPLMDDEFFDDKPFFSISPELERAADYYARKKQYDRAATAALYSGFVQQHYGENKIAMQSFKDAELYGDMAGDSLAVAMAQYWMGKMLYDDGMEQDALAQFRKSSEGFGHRYTERAKALNSMACCHLLRMQHDSAEVCLDQGLAYAKDGNSGKIRLKVLNNYAALNRLRGQYNQALDNLRVIEKEMDSTEMPYFYLNKAIVHIAMNDLDSANVCFNNLKPFLFMPEVKEPTKASAYNALSRFAKNTGNDSLALQYREMHEKLLFKVMQHRQNQTVYRIQRQYDHDVLQSKMDLQIIRWHRVVFIIGIFAILGLTAFAVSQIRLARIRKQESDAKTNLFHFMQQNEALLQRHKEFARQHSDLMQKHGETEKVLQLLLEEKEKYKFAYQDYAEKFSNAQFGKQKTIMKLAIYLNGKGEAANLNNLKQAVFDDQTPWEAIFSIFDTLFPNVRENLVLQYPELTEAERKDIILSFFNVSRQDEADLLGITIHSLDKLRNAVRKKMQDASFEVPQKPKNERK